MFYLSVKLVQEKGVKKNLLIIISYAICEKFVYFQGQWTHTERARQWDRGHHHTPHQA